MIQITKDKDEIIFHETPVRLWLTTAVVGVLFGALFFFGALYFTGSIFFGSIAGVLVFAAAAYIFLSENPSITVKVNKKGRIISIRKKSLVSYRFDIYNFEEVVDLIYVEKIAAEQKFHQIILPLRNGEKINISSQMRAGDYEYLSAAKLLNSYIFNSSKLRHAKARARELKRKPK